MVRSISVGASASILIVAAVLSADLVGAGSDDQPVGYVRSVEKAAYIISVAPELRRPAEPFTTILPGETIVARGGKVTLVDVRLEVVRTIPADGRFTMSRAAGPAPTAGREGLLALLRRITKQPTPRYSGTVRGGKEVAVWPDGASFGTDSVVLFRWSTEVSPLAFVLSGPGNGGPHRSFRLAEPPNPVAWPLDRDMPRNAGWYDWKILGVDDAVLASGTVRLLSSAEEAERRAAYRREAAERFSDQQDIAAELLAAADGCFLR